MADDTQQDAPPIDVPTIQIGIEVGLRGITVKIPESFWTDPGQNIVAPDGNRIWQHRMNACMAAIAQGFSGFVTAKGYMLENGELRVSPDEFPAETDERREGQVADRVGEVRMTMMRGIQVSGTFPTSGMGGKKSGGNKGGKKR